MVERNGFAKNVTVSPTKSITSITEEISENYVTETNITNEKSKADRMKNLNFFSYILAYVGLAKIRLTALVVISAMGGFWISPGKFEANCAFWAFTIGTFLASSSANACNQLKEVEYDALMTRTKNRPIVQGIISHNQALIFAILSGSLGGVVLWYAANPLTSFLGMFTIFLYALVYTPMKRTSVYNTWVGSVVGAIPPIMGWTASTNSIDIGACLLGYVLFAWQFPHFCALSWNLRQDYARPGYKMMSVENPQLCKSTALRYGLILVLLSFAFPLAGITSWYFSLYSVPLNGYYAYLSYRFYVEGTNDSSRKLFRFSLPHLPLLFFFIWYTKLA